MKAGRSLAGVLVLLLASCRPEPAPKPGPPGTNDSIPEKPKILCLGTSLTAAFGLKPEEGWVALIRKKTDSLGYPFDVVMAGVSGETTSGLRSRLGWMLQGDIRVVILESGANDGLRGTELSLTRKNLAAIADTLRSCYPEVKIILAGMAVPPNMGPAYTKEFAAIFPGLASEKNLTLIPFLLEGVGGNPTLNLPDGIHPNPEGQKRVAETVWKVLKPVLDSGNGTPLK